MSVRDLWIRRLLALDLGLYSVALIALALLPPTTLSPPEVLAIALAGLALVGVLAQACRRIHLPGEHWAYLAVACVGMYAFLGYGHLGMHPYWIKVPVLVFLASGIASAAAAHVIIGGPPRGRG